MAEGVVTAWETLKPKIPIIFTIHGTGEDEATALVEARLGITPHDLMDDAVKAAVAAAKGGRARPTKRKSKQGARRRPP
jgi:succinyl-CoA synthetase beta subunit